MGLGVCVPYRGRALVAVALIAVAATGCGSAEPGTPKPSPGQASTTTTADDSSSPSAQALPPRPREIRINEIDLCALWTPQQLSSLGLPHEPSSRTSDEGKPWCFYNNKGPPDVGYSITPEFDEDVSVWLGPGQVEETSVLTIAGFPAVQLHGRSTTIGCDILVSTAQRQYLQVHMGSIHHREFTIEQMCELAKKAATFATQTLQTLR